jgi:predicted PurR-regulated permease PerM
MLRGAWWKGLVLLGWGAGVVGLIDNLIRPLVIKERVNLHMLYVFVAILGGIKVISICPISI